MVNELIYGGPISVPFSILRDMWVQPDMPEYKNYSTYMAEVRKQIIMNCTFARENLEKAGELQRTYSNKKQEIISLKSNNDILIMLLIKSIHC